MGWLTFGSVALNVLEDQIDLGTPDKINNRRVITVTVDLDGDTMDALGVNFQTLAAELERASAASGAIGYGSRVALVWQPDTTLSISFDLVPDAFGEVGYFHPSAQSFSHPNYIPQLQIAFNTTAYGRGTAQTILDGTTTYTNGPDSTIDISGLKGDVPGLVRLLISDVSDGVEINDIRVGVRSVPGMAAGDYQGVIEITPESSASTTDTDTVSTNIAQLTANTSAQQLGTFTKPSAKYTDGPLHVFARVRDHGSSVGQPTGLTLTDGTPAGFHRATAASPDANATSLSLTIVQPTVGNLMRMTVSQMGATTLNTPSGFTEAVKKANVGSAIAEYYRVADGTESTTVTVTTSDTAMINILYEEVPAIVTSSPLDQTGSNNGTGSYTVTADGLTSQAVEYAVVGALNSSSTKSISVSGYTSIAAVTTPASPAHRTAHDSAVRTISGTPSASLSVLLGGTDTLTAVLATYKARIASGGSLAADTYTIRVAGVTAGGSVGQASSSQDITVASSGSILANWTASSSGTPDHYRLFIKSSSGSYGYFETTDSSTSLTITTLSGATPGDPPLSAVSVAYGQYRLKTATASGTLYRERDWVSTTVANGEWETIFLGEVEGSQLASLWDDDPIGWKYAIECKHPSLNPLMDCDCLWLLPADEGVLHLAYEDADGNLGGLTDNRDWRYDLRPDYLQSAVLLEAGTTTDAGPLAFDGRPMIRPDAGALVIMASVGGLVSDVTNCQFKVTLTYTPLHLYLAGTAS